MGQGSVVSQLPHAPSTPLPFASFSSLLFLGSPRPVLLDQLLRPRPDSFVLIFESQDEWINRTRGSFPRQASRARSLTRTFGELSFWAISSGTTKPLDVLAQKIEQAPHGDCPLPGLSPFLTRSLSH